MTAQAHHRYILRITGMTCDGCAQHVTQALQQVPGVLQVRVPDWQSGRAEVVAEAQVRVQALIDAVAQAGYRARVLIEEPDSEGPGRPRAPQPQPTPMVASEADFDLIVVGGGSAGFAAALRAAEEGARVLMVNQGPIGGTCVNIGCVPSKFLIRAMAHYHRAGEARYAGVHTTQAALHWFRLTAQKDALVADLRRTKYEDVLAAYPTVTYTQGKARLAPGPTVQVNGASYRAPKVVLATGARPWAPPIPGMAEAGYLTSTTALALRSLPRTLVVLGGNAVGLELAQVFARAGVAVTLVERLPRIAPFEDEEVSRELARHLEAEGLRILTRARTERVERTPAGYRLHLTLADGQTHTLEAERLLVTTGRRPNTAGLGLEALGIATDRRGAIRVDEHARTTHPDVYAAGDCAALPQFVYVAAHSCTVAAANALRGDHRILDLNALPRVIFTDPQVAAVGLTEAQAREQSDAVEARVLPLEHVPQALAARDTRGFIKLVAEAPAGRLLGAHIVAPEAGEIIQTATLAIRAGLTVRDLGQMLFPYLTLSEGLKLAAQTFEKDVTRLSCCAG